MKKTATANHAAETKGRKFPAEAYEYGDDVTPEGVEEMRELARHHIDGGDWEVIDGFGRAASAP